MSFLLNPDLLNLFLMVNSCTNSSVLDVLKCSFFTFGTLFVCDLHLYCQVYCIVHLSVLNE